MAITDDILTLEQRQKDFKKDKGKYIQAVATPEIIPMKDETTVFTKLRKPSDSNIEIDFTPTAKDYQFKVDVWTLKEKDSEKNGYTVTAMRDLGDGIIETVVKNVGEEITIGQAEKDGK